MVRTSRTARIVAEDRSVATGLTVDGAISSYHLSLRAGNKSPATIKTYLAALASFSRFLAERGMPRVLRSIRREHVEAFEQAPLYAKVGGYVDRITVDIGDLVKFDGQKWSIVRKARR